MDRESNPPPLGALWAASIVSAASLMIVVFALPKEWLDLGLGVPQWMLAIGAWVLVMGVVPSGAVMGLERFSAAAGVAALTGTTAIIGSWWGASERSATFGMGALLVANLVQVLGESIVVFRTVGWRAVMRHGIRTGDIRRVGLFAGPMMAVSMLVGVGTWLVGIIVLHGPAGTSGYAIYSIGMQWFALALFIPGMLSRVLLPRFVKLRGGGGEHMKRLVRTGAGVAAGAALVMAICGAALSNVLIGFYGIQYRDQQWFLAAFFGVAVISAPSNALGNAIVAQDGQWIWLALTLAWLCTLLLTAMAVQPLGAWSALLAQSCAAMVLAGGALFVARRNSQV
jgi:hypothetical protein